MATSSWTEVEDIALVEAWGEVYTDPPRRGQGGLWVRVQQYFAQLRGPDHGRTVDALSSRFRVIRLDCEKFERYYKSVEDLSHDLGEEDIKAVALINYRHKEGHDFEHVSQWETIRVW
ncbi:hypothetical protein HanPI659440_Chr06g0237671 [Helianthus annuus]|nr:hypothetical protein HanPI659440_Chr06g0237671 [Helianthus annuus]